MFKLPKNFNLAKFIARNKEKKPTLALTEEQKAIVQAIKIPLFICIGVLLLTFILLVIVLSDQSSNAKHIHANQEILRSVEISQENNTTRIQRLDSKLSKMSREVVTTDKKLIKGVISATKNNSAILTQTEKVNTQLKGLNSSIHSRLSTQEKELNRLITNLKKDYQVINDSANKLAAAHTGNHLVESKEYRIYATTPYGVTLQDKAGNYIVAQINKDLSIGTISAISESKVIAGNQYITPQKDFKLTGNIPQSKFTASP